MNAYELHAWQQFPSSVSLICAHMSVGAYPNFGLWFEELCSFVPAGRVQTSGLQHHCSRLQSRSLVMHPLQGSCVKASGAMKVVSSEQLTPSC